MPQVIRFTRAVAGASSSPRDGVGGRVATADAFPASRPQLAPVARAQLERTRGNGITLSIATLPREHGTAVTRASCPKSSRP